MPDPPVPHNVQRRALMVVSWGVLLASATWFSGSAVARELADAWNLDPSDTAWLTNATQYGFIVGTLGYALTNIADRFSARWVFFVSASLGAACNLGFAWLTDELTTAIIFRFATGVTLAGVYPVGMKIIASWFRDGLGWRLGVMVGFLTVGTALPYGIVAFGGATGWRSLATAASAVAALGGLLVVAGIADGPYLRTRAPVDIRVAFRVFSHRPFRYAALGYFGHMWELYALWSLASFYLAERFEGDPLWAPRVPLVAFFTIAVGIAGCICGGLASRTVGEKRVATIALLASGLMCLLSGFAFNAPPVLVCLYLAVWGFFVVADSPQFSALIAHHCPAQYTGTALTVVNGIGFAVTTVTIWALPRVAHELGWRWAFVVLSLGPAIGLWFCRRLP